MHALTPTEFTQSLRAGDEAIFRAYKAGTKMENLVQMRVTLIDNQLRNLWHQYFSTPTGIALVAVGGYGRGELQPYSDIDLLILVTAETRHAQQTEIAAFLTFLWDAHLAIGHSVRTPEECQTAAIADITIATNLMETRLLAGDSELFSHMRQLTTAEHVWPVADFFQAKLKEQQQRHSKYHDTAYKLEPNVKESPGGLRDIQMIVWVAKRHFNAASLKDLHQQGFLNKRELTTLQQGQAFLWKVRYLLHHLTGRREDRLLFDLQSDLARAFGYFDNTQNLAIEQFMQRYYRNVMRLQRLNEMLLQLFKEAILHADETVETAPLNKHFVIHKGALDVAHEEVFKNFPPALFEVFLLLAQHPEIEDVRARTIRLIRDHLYLVTEEFRHDKTACQLFMTILRQPRGITHNLRRMNRYGLLAAYLPTFEKIVGRMQYDLFHVYTVDEHSLFVVRNLRRMFIPEHKNELPLCSQIAAQIPKPELLYLAGFFHDIAKGRGGDHSQLGAEEVQNFCEKHDINNEDTRLVSWLVRNHLLMSATAQRKDLNDPAVIHEFADHVRSINTLNHLYLLTVADIRGTNPELWNNWKDSLLKELYSKALRAIRRGLDSPIHRQERIEETRQDAIALLNAMDIDTFHIHNIWQDFGDAYFLRHSADEIAWHTKAILREHRVDEPMVLVRRETERGTTEVFIFTPDHDNLFALVTAVLGRLGTDIVDARIITSESGWAVDTFLILENTGEVISEPLRIEEIRNALIMSLRHPEKLPPIATRRAPRELKHFNVPLQVRRFEEHHGPFTALEVIATDRPGLLARIGRAFAKHHIRVHSARITTVGERAEDIFVISDQQNQPLHDSAAIATLAASIANELEKK